MTDYNTSLGINIPVDFDSVFQRTYGKYLETVLYSIDQETIIGINNYIKVRHRELSLEIPDVDEHGMIVDYEHYLNIDMNALNQDMLDLLMDAYTNASSDATAIPDITHNEIAYALVISLINANVSNYITLKDAEPTGLIASPIRANIGTILNTLQLNILDFSM